MLASILYLAIFAAGFAFMANRLYVGLKYSEINVKGAVYSREATPIRFWSVMFLASIGGLFFLLMVAVMGSALF